MKKTSEYGRGFAYNLGLFLCHSERFYDLEDEDKERVFEHWFYTASDHLFELQIPEGIQKTFEKKIHKFVKFCMERRLCFEYGYSTDKKEEDIQWAIKEAKNILLKWDKICGINSIEGEFE